MLSIKRKTGLNFGVLYVVASHVSKDLKMRPKTNTNLTKMLKSHSQMLQFCLLKSKVKEFKSRRIKKSRLNFKHLADNKRKKNR
jgi:hypothetical protein